MSCTRQKRGMPMMGPQTGNGLTSTCWFVRAAIFSLYFFMISDLARADEAQRLSTALSFAVGESEFADTGMESKIEECRLTLIKRVNKKCNSIGRCCVTHACGTISPFLYGISLRERFRPFREPRSGSLVRCGSGFRRSGGPGLLRRCVRRRPSGTASLLRSGFGHGIRSSVSRTPGRALLQNSGL